MADDQWLVAKIDRRVGFAVGASGIFTMAASVALLYRDISYLTFAIIVDTNAIVIFVAGYAAFKRSQRIRVLSWPGPMAG
ncbi:MAG: hypothetical protein B7X48_09595 [Acidiphilium sp. 34-60-192]|nr:MAG: hypothetical protein B7X48_09595 [Acidiphilium sp. 34-60-192]